MDVLIAMLHLQNSNNIINRTHQFECNDINNKGNSLSNNENINLFNTPQNTYCHIR